MQISIVTEGKKHQIVLPNALILNKALGYIITSKCDIGMDAHEIMQIVTTLKAYIKKHPHFELVEIESEGSIIKISL